MYGRGSESAILWRERKNKGTQCLICRNPYAGVLRGHICSVFHERLYNPIISQELQLLQSRCLDMIRHLQYPLCHLSSYHHNHHTTTKPCHHYHKTSQDPRITPSQLQNHISITIPSLSLHNHKPQYIDFITTWLHHQFTITRSQHYHHLYITFHHDTITITKSHHHRNITIPSLLQLNHTPQNHEFSTRLHQQYTITHPHTHTRTRTHTHTRTHTADGAVTVALQMHYLLSLAKYHQGGKAVIKCVLVLTQRIQSLFWQI